MWPDAVIGMKRPLTPEEIPQLTSVSPPDSAVAMEPQRKKRRTCNDLNIAMNEGFLAPRSAKRVANLSPKVQEGAGAKKTVPSITKSTSPAGKSQSGKCVPVEGKHTKLPAKRTPTSTNSPIQPPMSPDPSTTAQLRKETFSPKSKTITASGKVDRLQLSPEEVVEAFLMSDTSSLTSLSDLSDYSDMEHEHEGSSVTEVSMDTPKAAHSKPPEDSGFMPSAANGFRFKHGNPNTGRTAAQLDQLLTPPQNAVYEQSGYIAMSYHRVGDRPCAHDRDVDAMVQKREVDEEANQKLFARQRSIGWVADKDAWNQTPLNEAGWTVRQKRRYGSN